MKIGVVSLGCPKNLVDTELMLNILKNEGYDLTGDRTDADIIIVNTCGFIEDAKRESIDAILEMSALKADKCRKIIVTGCLSKRYGGQVLQEIPEVDAILGVNDYSKIGDVIRTLCNDDRRQLDLTGNDVKDNLFPEGGRIITTGQSFAYIKIAEGCDNRCSYCVIPSIRGGFRSRDMRNIVGEAERIADSGINEVILVAQDSTRYGTDIYGKPMLAELLENISRIDGIKWIRTLYWYPDEVYDGLIDAMAGLEKVCKYIDLPLQHASDRILGLMGRRASKMDIERSICKLRSRIPDLVLRTSMIVGFPTETDDDFKELLDFSGRMRFERLGTFIYSPEEGTAASGFKPRVGKKTALSRLEQLMEQQKQISSEFNRSRVGKTYAVKVDAAGIGRTYAESPEIDGSVLFDYNGKTSEGSFAEVTITDFDEYDLYGVVRYEPAE